MRRCPMNDATWTNDVKPLLPDQLGKDVYEKHFINSTATVPDNGHLDIHGVAKDTAEHYEQGLNNKLDHIILTAYEERKILRFFVEPKPEPKPEPKVKPSLDYQPIFTRYSMVDLDNEPDEPYLVDKMFCSQDIVMIYGDSGAGKGFVVIDLILSCLTGNPFADKFDVLRRLSVAYCTDEGLRGIKKRFRAARKKYNVEPNNPFILDNFHYYKQVPQLYDTDLPDYADVFISEFKDIADRLDILVIDTQQNASLGGDENHSRDANLIVGAAMRIARELGCVVILIHHTRKDGKFGSRGSGSYKGKLDLQIEVSYVTDDRSLMSCAKSKDDMKFKPLECDRIIVPDTKSVMLEWSEPKENETQADKVIDTMMSFCGKKMTANKWLEVMPDKPNGDPWKINNLRNELKRLADNEVIERDFQNPDKNKSNHNPFVYWIDDNDDPFAE